MVDAGMEGDGAEELMDLDLEYSGDDVSINFPQLCLNHLNFQKHIGTGKNITDNKSNRRFSSSKLAQFLHPTVQKLIKKELAISDP